MARLVASRGRNVPREAASAAGVVSARGVDVDVAPDRPDGRAVVQRKAGGGDCPAPPVAPEPPDPATDPKFKAVAADVKGKANDLKKHPPASAEADKAKAAAQAPAGDRDAQAKEKQADKCAER